MFITIIKFISFFFSFHTIFDVGFCVYAIIRIFNWPSMISFGKDFIFHKKMKNSIIIFINDLFYFPQLSWLRFQVT